MIVEKMLELLCLWKFLSQLPNEILGMSTFTSTEGITLNIKAMMDRLKVLQCELIKPYVISKTSKEE